MTSPTHTITQMTTASKSPIAQLESGHRMARKFLLENPTWSIDSIVNHLLTYYSDYGVTKDIVAAEIKDYVMER